MSRTPAATAPTPAMMLPATPAPIRSAPDLAVVEEAEAAAAAALEPEGAAVVALIDPVREVTMPLDVELAIMLLPEPDCDADPDDEAEEDIIEEDEPEPVTDAEADARVEPAAEVTARLAAPPPIVPTVVQAEVAPAG